MSILKSVLAVSLVLMMHISCSEQQDFGQYEDLDITPTFETSIFYIKAQESLINLITGPSFFSQNFNFDAFEEAFFSERVIEGTITYELENSTSKDVEISIEFLNEAGDTLDTEFFQMMAAPPSGVLRREVAYGTTGKNLDILRNTSNIRLNARNLGDNTSVSDLPDPALVLKSSGQFMVRLK